MRLLEYLFIYIFHSSRIVLIYGIEYHVLNTVAFLLLCISFRRGTLYTLDEN